MGHVEDFQRELTSVMEDLMHSAVTKTTRLFETTVHAMKAELMGVRKQNDTVEDIFVAERSVCKKDLRTRDIGVQCIVSTPQAERPAARGPQEDAWDNVRVSELSPEAAVQDNQQLTHLNIKAEEDDMYSYIDAEGRSQPCAKQRSQEPGRTSPRRWSQQPDRMSPCSVSVSSTAHSNRTPPHSPSHRTPPHSPLRHNRHFDWSSPVDSITSSHGNTVEGLHVSVSPCVLRDVDGTPLLQGPLSPSSSSSGFTSPSGSEHQVRVKMEPEPGEICHLSFASHHPPRIPEHQPTRTITRPSTSKYRRLTPSETPRCNPDNSRKPPVISPTISECSVTLERHRETDWPYIQKQPSGTQPAKREASRRQPDPVESPEEEEEEEEVEEEEDEEEDEEEENQCEVCGFVADSASLLRHHRKVHRSERDWVCYQCGEVCPNERSFTCHLLLHTYPQGSKPNILAKHKHPSEDSRPNILAKHKHPSEDSRPNTLAKHKHPSQDSKTDRPTDRHWKTTTTTTTHQPSSTTPHQPSSATTHQPSSATPHQNDVPEQPRRLSARKSKSVYRRLMVLEKPKLKTENVPLADDHRAPTKSQAATKPHGVTVDSSSQQPSASQSHKSISEQLSSSSQSEKKNAPAHDEKNSQPSSSVPENKCEVCGLVVSSAVALRQHWRVHRSEMDCVCHKCGKICPNERSLTCHLLRHTYGERKKRRERAEKAASQKTEQVVVKTEKTTEPAGLLPAAAVQNTCQEQARRLSERMSKSEYRHRVISHTSQPPAASSVQTAHCTNTTTTTTTTASSSLTPISPHKAAPSPAKQQQQQPQPGQYPCQVCDEVFGSMASLEQHQEIHRDTAHPCGWCGRLFPSEEAMTSHARIHAEKKRYQCDRCDKSFPYRYSLTRHLVRHGLARSHAAATAATAAVTVTIGATSAASLKPFPCSICGKRLSNKSSHRVHMRLHMRGGPAAEKPHKCSVCSQPFQHLKSLVVHMKKHEGEKPYGCLTCGKRFLYANSLTLHQRIHTGEMPYQCTVCGKRFRQAGNLNFHVKQHHSVHTLVLTAGIAQRK